MAAPREIQIRYTPGPQMADKVIWEQGLKYTLYNTESVPFEQTVILTYRRKKDA